MPLKSRKKGLSLSERFAAIKPSKERENCPSSVQAGFHNTDANCSDGDQKTNVPISFSKLNAQAGALRVSVRVNKRSHHETSTQRQSALNSVSSMCNSVNAAAEEVLEQMSVLSEQNKQVASSLLEDENFSTHPIHLYKTTASSIPQNYAETKSKSRTSENNEAKQDKKINVCHHSSITERIPENHNEMVYKTSTDRYSTNSGIGDLHKHEIQTNPIDVRLSKSVIDGPFFDNQSQIHSRIAGTGKVSKGIIGKHVDIIQRQNKNSGIAEKTFMLITDVHECQNSSKTGHQIESTTRAHFDDIKITNISKKFYKEGDHLPRPEQLTINNPCKIPVTFEATKDSTTVRSYVSEVSFSRKNETEIGQVVPHNKLSSKQYQNSKIISEPVDQCIVTWNACSEKTLQRQQHCTIEPHSAISDTEYTNNSEYVSSTECASTKSAMVFCEEKKQEQEGTNVKTNPKFCHSANQCGDPMYQNYSKNLVISQNKTPKRKRRHSEGRVSIDMPSQTFSKCSRYNTEPAHDIKDNNTARSSGAKKLCCVGVDSKAIATPESKTYNIKTGYPFCHPETNYRLSNAKTGPQMFSADPATGNGVLHQNYDKYPVPSRTSTPERKRSFSESQISNPPSIPCDASEINRSYKSYSEHARYHKESKDSAHAMRCNENVLLKSINPHSKRVKFEGQPEQKCIEVGHSRVDQSKRENWEDFYKSRIPFRKSPVSQLDMKPKNFRTMQNKHCGPMHNSAVSQNKPPTYPNIHSTLSTCTKLKSNKDEMNMSHNNFVPTLEHQKNETNPYLARFYECNSEFSSSHGTHLNSFKIIDQSVSHSVDCNSNHSTVAGFYKEISVNSHTESSVNHLVKNSSKDTASGEDGSQSVDIDQEKAQLVTALLEQCKALVRTDTDKDALSAVVTMIRQEADPDGTRLDTHEVVDMECSNDSETENEAVDAIISMKVAPQALKIPRKNASDVYHIKNQNFEGRTLLKGGVEPRGIPRQVIKKKDKPSPIDPRTETFDNLFKYSVELPLPMWAEEIIGPQKVKLMECGRYNWETKVNSSLEIDHNESKSKCPDEKPSKTKKDVKSDDHHSRKCSERNKHQKSKDLLTSDGNHTKKSSPVSNKSSDDKNKNCSTNPKLIVTESMNPQAAVNKPVKGKQKCLRSEIVCDKPNGLNQQSTVHEPSEVQQEFLSTATEIAESSGLNVQTLVDKPTEMSKTYFGPVTEIGNLHLLNPEPTAIKSLEMMPDYPEMLTDTGKSYEINLQPTISKPSEVMPEYIDSATEIGISDCPVEKNIHRSETNFDKVHELPFESNCLKAEKNDMTDLEENHPLMGHPLMGTKLAPDMVKNCCQPLQDEAGNCLEPKGQVDKNLNLKEVENGMNILSVSVDEGCEISEGKDTRHLISNARVQDDARTSFCTTNRGDSTVEKSVSALLNHVWNCVKEKRLSDCDGSGQDSDTTNLGYYGETKEFDQSCKEFCKSGDVRRFADSKKQINDSEVSYPLHNWQNSEELEVYSPSNGGGKESRDMSSDRSLVQSLKSLKNESARLNSSSSSPKLSNSITIDSKTKHKFRREYFRTDQQVHFKNERSEYSRTERNSNRPVIMSGGCSLREAKIVDRCADRRGHSTRSRYEFTDRSQKRIVCNEESRSIKSTKLTRKADKRHSKKFDRNRPCLLYENGVLVTRDYSNDSSLPSRDGASSIGQEEKSNREKSPAGHVQRRCSNESSDYQSVGSSDDHNTWWELDKVDDIDYLEKKLTPIGDVGIKNFMHSSLSDELSDRRSVDSNESHIKWSCDENFKRTDCQETKLLLEAERDDRNCIALDTLLTSVRYDEKRSVFSRLGAKRDQQFSMPGNSDRCRDRLRTDESRFWNKYDEKRKRTF